MNKIIANTFTPLYDEVEDRIILVINYQDAQNRVDFMITRNFILKILPAADEFLMRYYPEKQLQSLSIETSEATPQESLSQTNSDNLEFFAKEKELLVNVNFSFENATTTTLLLSSQKSTTIATLDQTMLVQLIKTIKVTIPNFSWGIAINF